MNLADIAHSAQAALHLLAAFPGRSLLLSLVFLVGVESLMFIPRIGMVLKLVVASIMAAQTLAWFGLAAQGQPPELLGLLDGFRRPLETQALLAVAAMLPFAMGLLALRRWGGPGSVDFFFGHVRHTRPPPPALFLRFKLLVHVLSVPLSFLPAAVVLQGLNGAAALKLAGTLAWTQVPALLVLLAQGLVLEWALVVLARKLSNRAVAAAATALVLLAWVGWSFAFLYALSARALVGA